MSRRIPPLNALRAFEAAARLGSFVRAADELAVTPTAISHQIKGLEETLGVPLFVRLPRGLRLTAAGAAYAPELSRGFELLARAGDRLTGAEFRGLLHVNSLSSFAHCWLVPRLPKFRQRYPDLTVRVGTSERFVDFLREGTDLAVRYGKGEYPGLRSTHVMDEDVFPVASPALVGGERPLRVWADLAHHVLLHDSAAQEAEHWIRWATWLRRAGMADRVDAARGLEFDNSAMLIEAAVLGHGVALGRTALVARHMREGRLVALFGETHPADYSYYAVCPEASADQPKVRAFIDWLIEEATEDASWAAAPAPI